MNFYLIITNENLILCIILVINYFPFLYVRLYTNNHSSFLSQMTFHKEIFQDFKQIYDFLLY